MGCAFCAIPQFRGQHRSRPLADIVAEVEGLAARGIQEAILVSQDTLAYGRDLSGNGDIGDLLLALSDTPMPWIRPMYLHPAHVNERLDRQVAAGARRAIPRHAGPARRRRRAARDAPRRHRAAHEGRHRAASATRSRRHAPHHRARRLPGRDGAPRSKPARLRGGRGVRPPRRLHLLGGGGHAGGGHGGPGARRGDGRARRPRPGPPGPARVAAPEGPLRHAPDRAGGRAERRPRVPLRGADRRARRPRSTAWCCCATAGSRPGRFAEVSIVEVEGYELVGESE